MGSPITTHILDTAAGHPAGNVEARLEHRGADGQWSTLGTGVTDDDGRINDLLDADSVEPGVYRITFAVGAYHQAQGVNGFYPEVTVAFEIRDASQHYHVPLLLNPFGYSTYRGS